MTRVAAIAGRIAASVFTVSLTSCAILALTAISYDGAQTFAQTPPPPPAPANAAPAAPKLDAQQLDALTAPIAAYPDALLAQVLMATTFPDDVTAAAAWSKDHPQVKGDDAVKAVSNMPWDPSVQSLVAFPQALATMAQNPNWVDAIGQAFLAQSSDVMDSVQRLRQAAYKAGNLKTSEQQKVEVQPANNTIIIQPANPQLVYVPTYNPTTFYGPWPYAAYPPTYLPPPPGYAIGTALATGLAFGAGIAITNSLWGGCDWGRHDVNVNVNRYNNINVNHRIDANRSTSNWDRTNAMNNRSRMQANGNRPGGANGRPGGAGGGADRSAYRGRDNAQRDQARQTLSQRTGQNMSGSANDRVNNIRQGGGAKPGAGGNRAAGAGAGGSRAAGAGAGAGGNRAGGAGARAGGGAGAANRADVGNRAQNLNRDNALRDAGNGNASRQSMDRGQQSRAAANSRGGAMGNAGGGNRAAAASHTGGGLGSGGGGGARGGGGLGGGGGGGRGGGGGGGGGGHRRH